MVVKKKMIAIKVLGAVATAAVAAAVHCISL